MAVDIDKVELEAKKCLEFSHFAFKHRPAEIFKELEGHCADLLATLEQVDKDHVKACRLYHDEVNARRKLEKRVKELDELLRISRLYLGNRETWLRIDIDMALSPKDDKKAGD